MATPVFAFGASGCKALYEEYEDELPVRFPFLLSHVEEIPEVFTRIACKNGANLKMRLSKTTGLKYLMNICRCGTPLGDHFLFNAPGHAFFPLQDDEVNRIVVRRTNAPTGPVDVSCRIIDSNVDLIFESLFPV